MKKNEQTNYTGMEIAVIGMAGRFPGAKNIQQFWSNLENGVESVSFFTVEELEEAGVDPQLLKNPKYVRAYGHLEDSEYFDAAFFNYTPREAEIMDPQLRFFHECAWESLEDAGYDPFQYPGLIGLYAGNAFNPEWVARTYFQGSGNSSSHLESLLMVKHFSTRISYNLNLKGPSLTISTACSTSLVTIHTACMALLSGECDMALAGGISILMLNKSGYLYQEGMINSSDGRCRAFDKDANGTVFGDGVGIVVLKKLEDAMADNDNIHAIIKGSAINNDGLRKVGYTAPSIEGQAEVIRTSHLMAEIQPQSIGYIEAHGTGTSLGDPVEIEAMNMVFPGDKKKSCAIGSVKTNIGHLNLAAGVTGFIKAVLSLKHKKITPSLHFETANPEIDFENSPFYVSRELKEWTCLDYPLRAGVSSFGMGGTNAHVVLEEAPAQYIAAQGSDSGKYKLLMFSAKDKTALDKIYANMTTYLKENRETDLADIAYTLQVGRKAFPYKKFLCCADTDEAIAHLETAGNENVDRFLTKDQNIPVVFMFPGQGAQYAQMGRELYETEPLFKQEVDHCLEMLAPLMEDDLMSVLYPDAPDADLKQINQTRLTQPLLFVLEYALAKLLIAWGISPGAMIGHSIGEYVAACLSGVFSLQDALTLVALRGKYIQQLPTGSMLGISLSEESLKPLLTLNEDISLATVNSPSHCAVSGTDEAIDRFARELENLGHKFNRLHTSHAFHSYMMDPMLEKFESHVKSIPLNQPDLPYMSNVSGDWITAEDATDPAYWVKHLRETVRFSGGVKELMKDQTYIYMEVGPGNVLSTFVRAHGEKRSKQMLVNLIRHPRETVSDARYLLHSIGRVWLYGAGMDWGKFYGQQQRRRISLPTYPFTGLRFKIKPLDFTALISGTGDSSTIAELSGMEESSAVYARSHLPEIYTAPANDVEKAVSAIMQQILGLDKISTEENFFELGGDSLKATTLTTRISQQLAIKLPVSEVFNSPTIQALSKYINLNSEDEGFVPITPADKKAYYPLYSVQRRLYVLQQTQKDNLSYNISVMVEMLGEVDKNRIQDAFRTVIQRHQSFRTTFETRDGEPVQIIHDHVDFDVEFFKLDADRHLLESEKLISKNFIRPFDLAKAPALRVGLLTTAADRHLLMLDVHHIIFDGTSMAILVKEFMTLYQGGTPAPVTHHYKDYSQWQQTDVQQARIIEQENFWLEQFQAPIPLLNLPTDFPRPQVKNFEGAHCTCRIESDDYNTLKQIAAQEEATLFMVLLAIYNVFLLKLSGQEDIIVGTSVANRRHPDLTGIIGMFVNALALRNYPKKEATFTEFLADLKSRTVAAFDNQDFQFEFIVDKVVKKKDRSRNPLFDVMFVLNNEEIPEIEIPGLKMKRYSYEHTSAQLDLKFRISESKDALSVCFEYSTSLFKKETIERFLGYYKDIVKCVIQNQGIKLGDISVTHDLVEVHPQEAQIEFRL